MCAPISKECPPIQGCPLRNRKKPNNSVEIEVAESFTVRTLGVWEFRECRVQLWVSDAVWVNRMVSWCIAGLCTGSWKWKTCHCLHWWWQFPGKYLLNKSFTVVPSQITCGEAYHSTLNFEDKIGNICLLANVPLLRTACGVWLECPGLHLWFHNVVCQWVLLETTIVSTWYEHTQGHIREAKCKYGRGILDCCRWPAKRYQPWSASIKKA